VDGNTTAMIRLTVYQFSYSSSYGWLTGLTKAYTTHTLCGWQVKLCDPLVTRGPYLSALEIRSS